VVGDVLDEITVAQRAQGDDAGIPLAEAGRHLVVFVLTYTK
jgi:hypothetical protein